MSQLAVYGLLNETITLRNDIQRTDSIRFVKIIAAPVFLDTELG